MIRELLKTYSLSEVLVLLSEHCWEQAYESNLDENPAEESLWLADAATLHETLSKMCH